MISRIRVLSLLCLTLLVSLALVACGDPTATTAPAPAAAPTTAPATTAAPTTAAATTAAPTTAAATTAAATTAASAGTTAAAGSATTAAGGAAGGAAPTPTAPLPTMTGTKEELGRQVFAQTCAGCHLQQGLAGGRAPQLSTSQNAINAAFVREKVRNSTGRMPKFDQTKVSDEQLENIILYLKAIHKS